MVTNTTISALKDLLGAVIWRPLPPIRDKSQFSGDACIFVTAHMQRARDSCVCALTMEELDHVKKQSRLTINNLHKSSTHGYEGRKGS